MTGTGKDVDPVLAHLAAVTTRARDVRTHLSDIQEARHDVHFRPSAGGVAMIGLRRERPQRGKSGYRDLSRLRARFESEFQKHCVDIDQGRSTPEKRLQSLLLSTAYQNERRMSVLDEPEMRFVTDELALPLGGGQRIVCDMLLVRERADGIVPVVMELKSARELTRLIEQVDAYAALVDAHVAAFERLFSVVLGEDTSFVGPAEKWIVWPSVRDTLDVEPRAAELRAAGLRVVTFVETESEFSFRVFPE